MFKMQISTQTANSNFRKEVTNNEKYILRKIGLKSQNPKFNISYKMTYFYHKLSIMLELRVQ